MGKKKREKSRGRSGERKIKAAKQERINRIWRIALLALAIVVGISIIAVVAWQSFRSISFEEAIKNPESRDKYVRTVVAKVGRPADIEVEYERKRIKEAGVNRPGESMIVTEGLIVGEGKFQPKKISVLPYLFESGTPRIEADLVALLLHEYHHTRQAKEDKIRWIKISVSFLSQEGIWKESLFLAVRELDAMQIELDQSNISNAFREKRKAEYLLFYLDIWENATGMDPNFIQSLKIEFFSDWMLNRPLIMEEREGKKIWYFQHPATGRKYYFSPDEILAIRQK